jgi:MFS transporter, DHA1 family, multidrug resistance protein
MEYARSQKENAHTHKQDPKFGKIHRVLFIGSIVFISAIGFVASDIYLPSLPVIANYFHKDAVWAQSTMSVFLITMAIFQIFSGSLSDKFGRKKILSICMAIFIISSYGCYLSSSIYELILFRIFQAIGACGGMSIGQAIVADLFHSKEMARILSITIPLVAFSPALAPVIGGHIEVQFNWQTNFLLLVGYGVVIIAILMSPIIPKLSLRCNNNSAFDFKVFINIITDKKFFGYALFMMASNATYFSFVAASPFLLHNFGYSPAAVGYALCAASFPYMLASLLGRKLSLKNTSLKIIFFGISLNIFGGLLFIPMFILNWHHIMALMIPVFIITIGNGLLMPFSSSSAISLYPTHAGMVTGSLGSLQLIAAGIGTTAMGIIENNSLLPLSLFVLSISFIAIFYFLSVYGISSLKNSY